MTDQLTIEQRFALTRARYEVSRMSRPALEKTALRLLKSRMEQKNGVQETLMASGIVFKIDEQQSGLPEIISEETFCELLELSADASEEMSTDIMDEGWEIDDIDDDAAVGDDADKEDGHNDSALERLREQKHRTRCSDCL